MVWGECRQKPKGGKSSRRGQGDRKKKSDGLEGFGGLSEGGDERSKLRDHPGSVGVRVKGQADSEKRTSNPGGLGPRIGHHYVQRGGKRNSTKLIWQGGKKGEPTERQRELKTPGNKVTRV